MKKCDQQTRKLKVKVTTGLTIPFIWHSSISHYTFLCVFGFFVCFCWVFFSCYFAIALRNQRNFWKSITVATAYMSFQSLCWVTLQKVPRGWEFSSSLLHNYIWCCSHELLNNPVFLTTLIHLFNKEGENLYVDCILGGICTKVFCHRYLS